MSRPLRIGGAALVVSGSVLLSRLLGLGREALLAGLIGVNAEGDLYRQAFTIPDFLNYLLAGAYLTITLIPILSRHLERGDQEAASRAFTSVYRFVGIAILALTGLMWVFAGSLVSLIFPEVVEEHARLVSLTRLVLPAQVFLVMGALLIAVQYTHRRFIVPALAPLIYNLGIIVGGLTGAAIGRAGPEGFLWGAVIGSAMGNFGLQWFGARRTGTWMRPVARGQSAVGEYLMLALPLMIGQSIAVLDEQFVRFFGQVEEGGTSALSFARQLNMVPIGVVAQAAGVAAYPFLARLAARDDDQGLARTTARAARGTMFAAFLAAAALVAVAVPLVRVLYLYGEFTEADAGVVGSLLGIYALSIPAWGLHQILSRHFYAKRKMWTPVLIGTVFTALAVPIWLVLRDRRGVEGMAIASTLVMTAYALAMLAAWWRDSGPEPVWRLLGSMGRGLVAAITAAVIGRSLVGSIIGDEAISTPEGILAVVVGVVTVVAVFLVATLLLRSPELRDLRRRGGPGSEVRDRRG
jgi:putative peptidoglycan lipid II flippase